ncbi:MAG TPA: BrnA antitoxin family protein [Candidatus Sulfotelmatobacter sp.]|nr:BrnA antitoxin family protein [Candidatus Sulfotelmatobacter sp.]
MAGKKRLNLPLGVALEFYRPLKKPITVRIDADVLAWFKKDGKRYQTRINTALRKVMEKEMRQAGR